MHGMPYKTTTVAIIPPLVGLGTPEAFYRDGSGIGSRPLSSSRRLRSYWCGLGGVFACEISL